MSLSHLLTDLEQGKISADEVMREFVKLREKIQALHDKPPYDEMKESVNPVTREAAENATLGWQGGLSTALLIIDNMIGELPETLEKP